MHQIKNQTGNLSLSEGRLQITALFILRMVIGWHFLYEGLFKIFTPGWTSKEYLLTADWIFSGTFQAIAQSPGLLSIIDFINMALLTFVGVSLILGFYSRVGSLTGAFLVMLYYVAHPPFGAWATAMPAEGHYLIVDKNLIEFFGLLVLAVFPASAIPGFDRIRALFKIPVFDRIRAFFNSRRPYNHLHPQKQNITEGPQVHTTFSNSRRELIRNLVTLPVLGGFLLAFLNKRGWSSSEEAALKKTDSVSGATRVYTFAGLDDLKGKLPTGKIGGIEMSRLIFGGNLINGAAHSRDLIYVSPLVRRYFTDERIMQSWFMAEQCGINTMTTWPTPRVLNLLKVYRQRGGKIQWLGHCNIDNKTDNYLALKQCIDNGAIGIYIAGDQVETKVYLEHRVDDLGKALDFIKENKLFAGLACHMLQVPITCEEAGLNSDFYMKTFHPDNYWSATPKDQRTANIRIGDPKFVPKTAFGTYHDNIWCIDAEETKAYMKNLAKPWIGFKVLAAGAVEVADGFKYAFEGGADFIHVGMFDFQIVNDVNICSEILAGKIARERPWYS